MEAMPVGVCEMCGAGHRGECSRYRTRSAYPCQKCAARGKELMHMAKWCNQDKTLAEVIQQGLGPPPRVTGQGVPSNLSSQTRATGGSQGTRNQGPFGQNGDRTRQQPRTIIQYIPAPMMQMPQAPQPMHQLQQMPQPQVQANWSQPYQAQNQQEIHQGGPRGGQMNSRPPMQQMPAQQPRQPQYQTTQNRPPYNGNYEQWSSRAQQGGRQGPQNRRGRPNPGQTSPENAQNNQAQQGGQRARNEGNPQQRQGEPRQN